MNISIQSKGGTPIYEQIATQIKEAILAGKLNKDDALPSIRALSADIKVSVITTKKAYEGLERAFSWMTRIWHISRKRGHQVWRRSLPRL